MPLTGPAVLSLIGAIMFLGIWIVYLFVAQPEGAVISNAVEQLEYTFSQSAGQSVFFVSTVFSFFLCTVCTAMFWKNKAPIIAMLIVGLNTILALTFYDWSTAIVVAGPLLFTKQVIENA